MPYISCWNMRGKIIPIHWRNILTTFKTLTETASELGKETKDTIEDLSRSAAKKLDDARDGTADALHTAASSVRTTGRQSSEAIGSLATGAADRLDATVSFVEDCDVKSALTGLRKFGRRHQAGSLVAAVAVGFLAGSAMSRVTRSCGRGPKGA